MCPPLPLWKGPEDLGRAVTYTKNGAGDQMVAQETDAASPSWHRLSSTHDIPRLQRGHPREGCEVPVVMQDNESVPDGARGDQAIDPGSNRKPRTAGGAVEVEGFFEQVEIEGRLDHG